MRKHGGVDREPAEIVEMLLDRVVAQLRIEVPWRPGARELLAAVNNAGIPTALVTMSWKRFADQVVECLPSGSFRVSVTGDEVTRGKPHPDPYLLAAERLGVDARDCVAIEDSPTGVRSALAAGCRVLGVPHVIEIPSDLDQGSGQLVIAQSLVGKTLSDLVW
jgi:HAD superfamily hydrolase (TIGR01509 family)